MFRYSYYDALSVSLHSIVPSVPDAFNGVTLTISKFIRIERFPQKYFQNKELR